MGGPTTHIVVVVVDVEVVTGAALSVVRGNSGSLVVSSASDESGEDSSSLAEGTVVVA